MQSDSEVEDEYIAAAVRAFRVEFRSAVRQMQKADSPPAFMQAERELHRVTRAVAKDVTQRVVQGICDDKASRAAASKWVVEKAAAHSLTMRQGRDRETDIRTLGGGYIRVSTYYMRAVPRGGGAQVRGKQGAGVYPVLDMLGILGRSTLALRLQVAHAVVEANSVKAAREVLSQGGTTIDHKAALRLTYLVCDDALSARDRATASTATGNDEGEFVGKRVAVAIDGGRVNIRRRVAGRPKAGGRKHFVSEWREPKVLTVYVVSADGKRDKRHRVVIDGTLKDADAAFALLTFHRLRLGVHRAEHVVFLGDGAKWIWKRTSGVRAALQLPPEWPDPGLWSTRFDSQSGFGVSSRLAANAAGVR